MIDIALLIALAIFGGVMFASEFLFWRRMIKSAKAYRIKLDTNESKEPEDDEAKQINSL